VIAALEEMATWKGGVRRTRSHHRAENAAHARTRRRLLLEKPKPEILMALAVPVTGLKPASLRQLHRLLIRERNTQPGSSFASIDGTPAPET
jgi:hypothetical protein